MMIRIAAIALAGGLLAAAPLHGQAGHQHGTHQHGTPQATQQHQHGAAEHGSHGHCPMHAQKHGAEQGAAHGAHHGAGHGAAHGAHDGTGHGAEQGAHHGAGHGDASHRNSPMMLLQHREALKLTAEQVQQLEALQAAHKADCERRMALVKAADEAAVAALERTDLAAYEAKLREAAGYRIECKVDMARISQAGLALLTAEQRAHLAHAGHAAH
jgi:hypothetical protein